MSTAELRLLVLSRPAFDEGQASLFLDLEQETWRQDPVATTAEQVVEFAGRICYMSFGARQSPRTNREYIRNLIDQGHESVLEHAVWTFLLTGVSRNFTHQLVRHRVGFSYSQLSQQYHDERGAATVIPDVVSDDPELTRLWAELVSEARSGYKQLIEALGEREQLARSHDRRERLRAIRTAARGILPSNTETKIAVTANARSLRHFLKLRGGLTGDEEMRRVSVAMLEVLQVDAPAMFEDYRIARAADGRPLVQALDPRIHADTLDSSE